MSYDNVILFGAGASFDAKIPLLKDFVDAMWNFAIRGKSSNGPLSEEDKKLFNEAIKIRDDLERYHSRANFNIKNLEDILSLLSFEALAAGETTRKYDAWVKAISKTIFSHIEKLQPHILKAMQYDKDFSFTTLRYQ